MKKEDTPLLDEIAKTKKQETSLNEDGFTVVKRNGKLVPFQRARILNAVTSAFKETKGETFELNETVEKLTDGIVTKLLKLAAKGASLTVEGIQDFVEVSLMKKGHHDVARSYIIYRFKRKEERDTAKRTDTDNP